MLVYEVYLNDSKTRKRELIGVLPEKRKNAEETNLEILLRWTCAVLGTKFSADKISFVRKYI